MALIRTLLGCAAAICIAMPVFAAEQTANPDNNNAQQIVIADSKQNATAPTATNPTAANSTATTSADAQKATDAKAADANKDMKAATSVNINTATAEGLMGVKGIGKKRAEAIIKYREQNGPFKSVDDLSAVKGISKKFIEKNRNQLTIG